ncbi:MAG: UDP-N-acetylmuramate--L-alanine ligase [Egibacteraceae bacterium]
MTDLHLDPSMRVHLIGVTGAGMSALARLLCERGHPVTGSDLRAGPVTQALTAMGATIHVGHEARHVDGADLVVWSNAIPPSNPELARAAQLGVPRVVRADLLALLMVSSRRILVTGTHGKTTTTSMVTVALRAAGLDPSFAIGGALQDGGASAHHGEGGIFVAEADEAFRSFLRLTPDCAVVTNVEMDHHDEYADLGAVADAFHAFLARRPPGGLALACADDPGAAALLRRATRPTLSYGEHPHAEVRINEVRLHPQGSAFRLDDRGEDLGEFHLRVLGRHNVRNAVAAVAATRWAGAEIEAVRAALGTFTGAQRRFQRVGEAWGVVVVDDYAHHPTEVSAVISAARQARPTGRVIVVFQPHLHSRTLALGKELGSALAAADLAVVTDVYGAREEPREGSDAEIVSDAAAAGGTEAHLVRSLDDAPAAVAALARPGDLVLTLGAGTITEVGPKILALLGAAT